MSVATPIRLTDPVDRLDEAMAQMTAASADILEAVWDCEDRGLWRRDGATSMSAWLAARYGLARATAREWVRMARALRELPRLFGAYRSGRISWDQLRPLSRFVTRDTETYWARKGAHLRPVTLWREAERHRRVGTKDEREARRRRFLSLWWDTDSPMLCLQGMLPPEEGAAVEAALSRRAEQVVLTDQPENPGEARMADALVEAVTEAGGTGSTDRLVIHADARVVAGSEPHRGPWLAETEDGHRLSDDAVRRMACDSRVEWVLEENGQPVGIGRRGRAVPGPIARLLRHRDRGMCRFPGCERRRWLKAHHLVHWGDGGPTDLGNLILLCHAHHRLVHEGGWRTSGHPDRHLRFHDPGGRPVSTHPLGIPREERRRTASGFG
ncbi:MAG: DUF222 domain-containing protein [Actinomycetota bacterium]